MVNFGVPEIELCEDWMNPIFSIAHGGVGPAAVRGERQAPHSKVVDRSASSGVGAAVAAHFQAFG